MVPESYLFIHTSGGPNYNPVNPRQDLNYSEGYKDALTFWGADIYVSIPVSVSKPVPIPIPENTYPYIMFSPRNWVLAKGFYLSDHNRV